MVDHKVRSYQEIGHYKHDLNDPMCNLASVKEMVDHKVRSYQEIGHSKHDLNDPMCSVGKHFTFFSHIAITLISC
jgi:hypothetical protein